MRITMTMIILYYCKAIFLISIFARETLGYQNSGHPHKLDIINQQKQQQQQEEEGNQQQQQTCSPTSVSSSGGTKSHWVSYDLGLGKNLPVVRSSSVSQSKDGNTFFKENENNTNNNKNNFNKVNHQQPSSVYEASRFLVEYEATRQYPAPKKDVALEPTEQLLVSQQQQTEEAEEAEKFPTVSQENEIITAFVGSTDKKRKTKKKNHQHHKSSSKKVIASENFIKKQQRTLRQVKPKRVLEDVLVIVEHDFSGTTTPHSPATTTTTKKGGGELQLPTMMMVMPNPDNNINSVSLDLNSVWVEMLLHNQLTVNTASSSFDR